MDIATGPYKIRGYNVKMAMIYCLIAIGPVLNNPAVVLAQRGFGLEVHPLSFSAVASPTYSFPLTGNPAAQYGTGVRWKSVTPFGLEELRTNSFGIGIQNKFGNLGLEFHKTAFDLYNESVYAMGYGFSTSEFGIGGTAGMEAIGVLNYGKSKTTVVGAGFWKKISGKLIVEGVVNNVQIQSRGDFQYNPPLRVTSAIHYGFEDRFRLSYVLSAQSEWLEHYLVLYGTLPELLNTFASYNLTLATWMFGIQVKVKGIHGLYSMNSHQYLGWSRGFGFGYTR